MVLEVFALVFLRYSPVFVCPACMNNPTQALTVESLPELFFPQDLPLVVDDEPKTAWPAPLTATLALRSYTIDSSSNPLVPSFSEDASQRKSVQWLSSWTDCKRVVTGTNGWLEAEEAKTAPTLQSLDPIVQVRLWRCGWIDMNRRRWVGVDMGRHGETWIWMDMDVHW